jgi:hypothetical protein
MAPKSYEDVLMEFTEFRIHKFLLLYVSPVLVLVGTFGNVFSFIITAQSMSKVSTYVYLASLSITDLIVLWIGLLRLWVGQMTGVDERNMASWLCKLIIFLGYVMSDLSVWLIIAVTVERCIAVCFPLRASGMCNVFRARLVVGLLIWILCVINAHFFWTVEVSVNKVDQHDDVFMCDAVPDYVFFVKDVFPWVDAAIYSFLPFVIIIVLNCVIIRQVVLARRARSSMQNHENRAKGDEAKAMRSGNESNTKLTCMLLSVSFSFLLTTLPMNISLIVTAFYKAETTSYRQIAQLTLGQTVTELLMYVNHSINFFLYCATGKRFRRQTMHMCRCCRRCWYKQRHSSESKHQSHALLSKYNWSNASARTTMHVDTEARMQENSTPL